MLFLMLAGTAWATEPGCERFDLAESASEAVRARNFDEPQRALATAGDALQQLECADGVTPKAIATLHVVRGLVALDADPTSSAYRTHFAAGCAVGGEWDAELLGPEHSEAFYAECRRTASLRSRVDVAPVPPDHEVHLNGVVVRVPTRLRQGTHLVEVWTDNAPVFATQVELFDDSVLVETGLFDPRVRARVRQTRARRVLRIAGAGILGAGLALGGASFVNDQRARRADASDSPSKAQLWQRSVNQRHAGLLVGALGAASIGISVAW